MTTLYTSTHCPGEAYVPLPKRRRRIPVSALLSLGMAFLGFVVLLVCSAAAEHQQRCSWPVHTYQSCGDNQ